MQHFINEINKSIIDHKENLNERPNDFQVTYLSPVNDGKKYGYFLDANKKSNLEIKTEKLGHLFNKRRIFNWLNIKYPDQIISHEYVERCFNIFSLFLKKTNTYDGDRGYGEYYFSKWFKNYGIFIESRQDVLNKLLSQDDVRIMCFNIDEQEQNPNYRHTCTLSLDEKRNPFYMHFLEFSLDEMKDDWAYNIAINYLNTIPDFQQIYDMLSIRLKLPRDIINYICGFLDSSSS